LRSWQTKDYDSQNVAVPLNTIPQRYNHWQVFYTSKLTGAMRPDQKEQLIAEDLKPFGSFTLMSAK